MKKIKNSMTSDTNRRSLSVAWQDSHWPIFFNTVSIKHFLVHHHANSGRTTRPEMGAPALLNPMKIIRTTLAFASVITVLSLGTGLHAQDNGPADRPQCEHGPHGKPPFMKALDADGNGSIDSTELANAPAALATLDKNSDGQITADELRPPLPEGAPKPPVDEANHAPKFSPPFIAALDVDKDGTISAAELANATEELRTLDKDNDGILSREEFCGVPPEGGRPGGEPRHHGPGQ